MALNIPLELDRGIDECLVLQFIVAQSPKRESFTEYTTDLRACMVSGHRKLYQCMTPCTNATRIKALGTYVVTKLFQSVLLGPCSVQLANKTLK